MGRIEYIEAESQLLNGMWRAFDDDDSGTISIEELQRLRVESPEVRQLFEGLSIQDNSLNMLLSLADANKDGSVDFAELTDLILTIKMADVTSLMLLLQNEMCQIYHAVS